MLGPSVHPRGYPTLIGLRGSEKYKLRVTGHGTYGGNLHPTKLSPRMSGVLIVSTGDLCGPTYGVIRKSDVYRIDCGASQE